MSSFDIIIFGNLARTVGRELDNIQWFDLAAFSVIGLPSSGFLVLLRRLKQARV